MGMEGPQDVANENACREITLGKWRCDREAFRSLQGNLLLLRVQSLSELLEVYQVLIYLALSHKTNVQYKY